VSKQLLRVISLKEGTVKLGLHVMWLSISYSLLSWWWAIVCGRCRRKSACAPHHMVCSVHFSSSL